MTYNALKPSDITIRCLRYSDIKTLTVIMHTAIHTLARQDYSAEQCYAWSPKPVSVADFFQRISGQYEIYVASINNETPVAFIELNLNGHIDCFYCCPQLAKKGIGYALYNYLEEQAIKKNLSCLYVEASETARNFFLKQGFNLIKKQNLWRNYIQIHNYLMEKNLKND